MLSRARVETTEKYRILLSSPPLLASPSTPVKGDLSTKCGWNCYLQIQVWIKKLEFFKFWRVFWVINVLWVPNPQRFIRFSLESGKPFDDFKFSFFFDVCYFSFCFFFLLFYFFFSFFLCIFLCFCLFFELLFSFVSFFFFLFLFSCCFLFLFPFPSLSLYLYFFFSFFFVSFVFSFWVVLLALFLLRVVSPVFFTWCCLVSCLFGWSLLFGWCCLPSPPLGSAFPLSSVGWCCLVSSFLLGVCCCSFPLLLVRCSFIISSFVPSLSCVRFPFAWCCLVSSLFGWCCCSPSSSNTTKKRRRPSSTTHTQKEEKGRQHHPTGEGKNSNTTQKEGGDQAAPPNRRQGKRTTLPNWRWMEGSTTKQERSPKEGTKPSSTTQKEWKTTPRKDETKQHHANGEEKRNTT